MVTTPLSGTNVRLMSGVPFSNDYKHTRHFDKKDLQETYFMSKPVTHTETQYNFQRIEGRTFVAVKKSIDDLWGTNYLMFQNAQYNNKWFYAFVTKLEYVQKNTTYVHFDLDVLQSWLFDFTFKPSLVVREHQKLWNVDGSPVINTVNEGLDYGTEYEVVSQKDIKPMGDTLFMVVVSKVLMHPIITETPNKATGSINTTFNGVPQPLNYYAIPFNILDNPIKVTVDGVVTNFTKPLKALESLYKQKDAINNIVSVYVTDFIGLGTGTGTTLSFLNGVRKVIIADDTNPNIPILYIEGINTFSTLEISLGGKYADFTRPKESKLLMYPYTSTVLTDFKGNQIDYKNEYIKGQDLFVQIRGAIGTGNKVVYFMKDYLNGSLSTNLNKLNGVQHSLVDNASNDIPIITEHLASFLQGNRNSLENRKAQVNMNGVLNGLGSGIGMVASASTGNAVGVASSAIGMTQAFSNNAYQLGAIEAQKKDISNVPPSISQLGGSTAFDFGNGYRGAFMIKKQITSEYRRKLETYFGMFGYKSNEVKVPNVHTRQHFNYIETLDCMMTGNFNHEDMQKLKQIFNSGITLWHVDDIGNYALTNEVR